MELAELKKLSKGVTKLSEAKSAKSEFEDSAEFTDEFFSVIEAVKSKRWENWMKITDTNYPTKSRFALKNVVAAIKLLEAEIDKADKS